MSLTRGLRSDYAISMLEFNKREENTLAVPLFEDVFAPRNSRSNVAYLPPWSTRRNNANGIQRYYIWKSKQAEAQSKIWTDPRGYYFLNIMVVLPGQQGKGIGKALAQEVTRLADEEGKRCYLESSRDVPNMKIYEAMGFHFVEQMDCDDNGEICKLYCMVRELREVTSGEAE